MELSPHPSEGVSSERIATMKREEGRGTKIEMIVWVLRAVLFGVRVWYSKMKRENWGRRKERALLDLKITTLHQNFHKVLVGPLIFKITG